MKIGLTLPNRGILFGAVTVEDLLRLTERADASGRFQSVWVGDSLLGKPRLESVALLAAIAARTSRVRPGTACMASFPLRDPVLLAHQWASLDVIAGGRTVLVVCTGIVPQEGGRVEGEVDGLRPRDRVRRLVEWIQILRLLWTTERPALPLRERHDRAPPYRAPPPPDLDRQQRSRRPGPRGAYPPARCPLRRRVADVDGGARGPGLAAGRRPGQAGRAGPRPGWIAAQCPAASRAGAMMTWRSPGTGDSTWHRSSGQLLYGRADRIGWCRSRRPMAGGAHTKCAGSPLS